MATNKFKTVSLDEMIDKHIGKAGTERREAFENELRIDLLGQAIQEGLDSPLVEDFDFDKHLKELKAL